MTPHLAANSHRSRPLTNRAEKLISSVRPLARLTVVIMLVLSLGLHWTLLQTVAWTGMFVRYSQDATFKEAISKTFDGKHPCPLCHAIKQGKAEESQREQQQQFKPGLKLDLAVVCQTVESVHSLDYPAIAAVDEEPPSLTQAPPKPRPRLG